MTDVWASLLSDFEGNPEERKARNVGYIFMGSRFSEETVESNDWKQQIFLGIKTHVYILPAIVYNDKAQFPRPRCSEALGEPEGPQEDIVQWSAALNHYVYLSADKSQ